MSTFKRTLLTLVFVSLTTFGLFAQPGDPGGDPDNPVPITGIEWLLAAGGALGIHRLIKRKNKK